MMRALLLLALLPVASWAECVVYSWSVFPRPGSTIPANSRFVVEGFGEAQSIVSTIASRKPRLVTAAGAQLPLEVVEVNVGEFGLTQAVLRAKGSLAEGTRYTLKFESEGPARFTLGDKSASWTVGPADLEAPRWTTAPQATPGAIVEWGCGPQIEARVAVTVQDASPSRVRAKVIRKGKPALQYLLDVKEGVLSIGHGMCAGAFNLHEEDEWSLELSLVDLAGNETASPGAPLAQGEYTQTDTPSWHVSFCRASS